MKKNKLLTIIVILIIGLFKHNHMIYGFNGFPAFPTCNQCSVTGCIKTDTQYQCASPNSASWNNWCSNQKIFIRQGGEGSCPNECSYCNYYYSTGICWENMCVECVLPNQTTPTPTQSQQITPTSSFTPTQTPNNYPKCNEIRMYDETGLPITTESTKNLMNETVFFRCFADKTLDEQIYKFRVYEPCNNKPIELKSQQGAFDLSQAFEINKNGHYAVQCAVCNNDGTGCAWDPYTPQSCNN